MKLAPEVNKVYRDREGNKITILSTSSKCKNFPILGEYLETDGVHYTRRYSLCGRSCMWGESLCDLVSEYIEPLKKTQMIYLMQNREDNSTFFSLFPAPAGHEYFNKNKVLGKKKVTISEGEGLNV